MICDNSLLGHMLANGANHRLAQSSNGLPEPLLRDRSKPKQIAECRISVDVTTRVRADFRQPLHLPILAVPKAFTFEKASLCGLLQNQAQQKVARTVCSVAFVIRDF